MKNHREINGSESRSNGHVADKLYKKSVDWFSSIQLKNLDQNKVWENISQRLENLDKKVLSWFMISATTCTLLVAAGLELYDNNYIHKEEPFEQEEVLKLDKAYELASQPEVVNHLEFIESKKIVKATELSFEEVVEVKTQTSFELDQNEVLVSPQYAKKAMPKSFRITAKLNHIQSQIMPEFGASYTVFQKVKNNQLHQLSLGYSAQLNLKKGSGEIRRNQSTANHFVNMSYGIHNHYQKGWDAKLGYLINPDSQLYKKQLSELHFIEK